MRAPASCWPRAPGWPQPVDGVTTALRTRPCWPTTWPTRARWASAPLCIHPAQLQAVRAGFLPTPEQADWARRVLAATAAGSHAVQVDGKMVDRLVIEQAKRLLVAVRAGLQLTATHLTAARCARPPPQPTAMTQDSPLEHLRQWIGCSESRTETPRPRTRDRPGRHAGPRRRRHRARRAAAVVALALFPPARAPARDRRRRPPALGGFMPPMPLPRRMWAGGELAFKRPLRVGDTVTRTSTIADVQHKSGRSGELWFATVEHDLTVDGESVLSERQTSSTAPCPSWPAPAAAPASATRAALAAQPARRPGHAVPLRH